MRQGFCLHFAESEFVLCFYVMSQHTNTYRGLSPLLTDLLSNIE